MDNVLVGCPTFEGYEYCLQEYLRGIQTISTKKFDVLLVDNSKTDSYTKRIKASGLNVVHIDWNNNVHERLAESRNVLREETLSKGYSHFLSLEQDVIPPPFGLERLLSHQKKIVSGIYYKLYPIPIKNKDGSFRMAKTMLPLVFKPNSDPNKMDICYPTEVEQERLFKIRACGLGCVLIHREVLEKVKFRTDPGKDTYDDFLFCTDAVKNGFGLYADTSVKCKHLILKKGNVFK